MRIIGGKFKSWRLDVPHNIKARPTTDFAKEGLFNLLNNRIDFDEIDVLDLFSGTGSISFEFVSRGARSVISVEQNNRHITFIHKTRLLLEADNLTPLKTDVFRYIHSVRVKFDVIFADPPYELERLKEIPDLIFNHKLLKPEGILILEHSVKNNFEEHPHFVSRRNYGNVHFSFFE